MPAFRILDNCRAFLTTVRSVAVLTAKQAQLARIRELRLPSLYSTIGRHVMSLQTLPQDLSEAHDAVRSIEKGVACQPNAGCAAGHEGTSSEAKAWIGKTFQRLANASANATASVELQRAYETLGRNAVERHEKEAVPEVLASILATTRDREAELRESIASLQQAGITVVSQAKCLGALVLVSSLMVPAAFYAWVTCFALFGCAFWFRNRQISVENRSSTQREDVFGIPGLLAAALACHMLGSALPVSGAVMAYDWSAFRSFASGGGHWITFVSKATNLVALGAFVTLLTHRRLSTLVVGLLFAGSILSVLVNLLYVLFEPHLRMGFYLWFASFCLLAVLTVRELLSRRAASVGSCLIEERMPRFATAGLLAGLLLGLPMISGVTQAMIGSSAPSSSVAHTARPGLRKPAIQEPFDWGAAADRESAGRQEVSPDAGTQAFLGLLAGMAAQQQAQQGAQQAQMQQQQERAAFRDQMRNIQTQYSRMPGPPQTGSPYGSGQFGGGGSAPQPMQQYEGMCTKCGYRTGRQVSQSHRTCSQLGVGTDGTRPCGGVIVWGPAGGMPGAAGMVPQQQAGAFMPNRMQQFEGTCTSCGYRTGRQVNQSQRTCSQLGVGGDGTRPCGGVIAWAPAGAMPGAVPGLNGSAAQRQGGGYTPQRMQQFEGTCSKCGYRTGRQVSQSQRTCSQLGVGVDGTRPCGGVIIWGPAQGF